MPLHEQHRVGRRALDAALGDAEHGGDDDEPDYNDFPGEDLPAGDDSGFMGGDDTDYDSAYDPEDDPESAAVASAEQFDFTSG